MRIKTYVTDKKKNIKIPTWFFECFFITLSLFCCIVGFLKLVETVGNKNGYSFGFLYLSIGLIALELSKIDNGLLKDKLLMLNKESGKSTRINFEEYKLLGELQIAELTREIAKLEENRKQLENNKKKLVLESLEEKMEDIV